MLTIITGGQTGVDQGALFAAAGAGLTTGGVMPTGFLTESGPNPDLAAHYDLRPLEPEWGDRPIADQYRERTRRNVEAADVVLLLTVDSQSPGSRLTKRLAMDYRKSIMLCHVHWKLNRWSVMDSNRLPDQILNLMVETRDGGGVFLVAGTRESKAPGIGQWAEAFLTPIFRRFAEGEREG